MQQPYSKCSYRPQPRIGAEIRYEDHFSTFFLVSKEILNVNLKNQITAFEKIFTSVELCLVNLFETLKLFFAETFTITFCIKFVYLQSAKIPE